MTANEALTDHHGNRRNTHEHQHPQLHPVTHPARNIEGLITGLKGELSELIALEVGQRKQLRRMGGMSESFSRQALNVLERNRQIVPQKIALDAASANLRTLDQLRPCMVELARLLERCYDTEAVLGSAVMTVALQGYGLLKLIGRSEGLEPQRRELKATRFANNGRPRAKAPKPPAIPPMTGGDIP